MIKCIQTKEIKGCANIHGTMIGWANIHDNYNEWMCKHPPDFKDVRKSTI